MIGDYTPTLITAEKRESIIEVLSYLHNKKKYKVETFHIAVSIVDRYYSALDKESRDPPKSAAMAAVSMLLAAKLE